MTWKEHRRRLSDRLKRILDAAAGKSAALLLAGIHRLDRAAISNVAGAVMRFVGPRLREHRIGRDNLRAAFPEKSAPAPVEKMEPVVVQPAPKPVAPPSPRPAAAAPGNS